jgi:hypothetical protein
VTDHSLLANIAKNAANRQEMKPAKERHLKGLQDEDVKTRRKTIALLGRSDDASALRALRDFRNRGGPLLEPVRAEVQAALASIRQRALRRAPKLSVGMSMAQVVALLGPPTSTQKGSDIIGSYGSAMVMGSGNGRSSLSSNEYSVFEHPAGDFCIVFSGETVRRVHTSPYV